MLRQQVQACKNVAERSVNKDENAKGFIQKLPAVKFEEEEMKVSWGR